MSHRLLDRLVTTFRQGVAGGPDPSTDPGQLAADCGLTLDPWQREVVQSTARQQLLLCSRQSGKSLTAALKALHVAIAEPGSLTLLVAPAQRQAAELHGKVNWLLAALGPLAPAVRQESS